MMRTLLTGLATGLLALTPLNAAQAGEIVTYNDGDTVLEGYLARTNKPNAPLVLIVHQWMGLTDNETMRADMLAAAGYNALAIDMYGQGIRPADTTEAGRLATQYKSDTALAVRRMNAALTYAKTLKRTDVSRIAIIGYCFGGTMALDLARSGADLAAAISFHGALTTPTPVKGAGAVKAALQVHHGAADPLVPQAEVTGFMTEMDAAKADWTLIQYAGAVHAFTQKGAGNDPSKGFAYDARADKRSWAAAMDFLDETLGAAKP